MKKKEKHKFGVHMLGYTNAKFCVTLRQ